MDRQTADAVAAEFAGIKDAINYRNDNFVTKSDMDAAFAEFKVDVTGLDARIARLDMKVNIMVALTFAMFVTVLADKL